MMLPLVMMMLLVGSQAQQVEHTPDIPFNPRTPFTLPQQMFEFMEKYNWGDFHLVFHMSRKYYVIGDQGRRWLDRNAEKPAPFQEGDPNNGVEFLAMHRAMLEYLRQRFGKLPVTNDPEGRQTVSDVLDGWQTDDAVVKGLARFNGDVRTFQAGLANVNNFGQFRTEDDFGLFVQTSMRLQGTVDPNNPARRQYASDRRPGSGVHNWMHGQLQDDNSPITVGDPRTNLPNILFWRIHGWIENKWKQFEAAHRRNAAEQALYDGFMTQFRAHMISMSERGSPQPPQPVPTTTTSRTLSTRRTTTRRPTRRPGTGRSLFATEEQQDIDAQVGVIMGRIRRNLHRVHMASRKRVPWALVYHVRSRMFRNHVPECRTLTQGTTTDNCPYGPNDRPVDDNNRGNRQRDNGQRDDGQRDNNDDVNLDDRPRFQRPRRESSRNQWR